MKLIIKEEEAEKKHVRRKKPSPRLNGVVGSGVELTWLAWSPHRPSLLLRAHGGATVLLDCALGMETMASYLPCSIVRSNRISWQKKVHPYGKGVIPVLKHINDLVYVDLVPELRAIGPADVDLASLDAILISNTASLTALPILLAGKAGDDFRGAIYATDPILQLGKLVMENLCDLFERVDRPVEEEWAWKNIASSFPNPPASDPTRWHQFYSRETMEACLARVQRVFYRQDIVLSDELTVTPYSSGHSIGSCNWLISAGQQKIGYLAASSQRHSHPKPMETEAFEHMDALLLTSVSTIEQSPDLTVFKFINALVDTLKMGGNVLVPVVPTGLVYDLFECVLKAIEVNNLSRSIPIYFVSSIAECSFEFANIFSEWLSEDKGSRVFEPKEPFFHSELVRSGRIRVFDSLSGPFSRECRQPCIVFAGHPSLRIGEVVHLLDFWGGNSRNAIMMIDPDYPLETYYAPYKTLAIRAYYYPIETRLDCTQVYNKIISDLAPRHVLYPAEYAASFSTLPALLQTTLLRQNEPVQLLESQPPGNGGGPMVGVKRRAVEGGSVVDQAPKKRLRVDPELLMRIRPNADMQGLCPIQGLISSQEHIMELLPKHRQRSQQPITDPVVAAEDRIRKFSGRLTAQRLLEEFGKREIVAELLLAAGEPAAGGGEETLTIPTLSARIRMLGGGRRTLISCLNDANRKAIQAIVHQCLSKFTIPEPLAPAEESPAALAASALATAVVGGPAGTETTTTATTTTTLSTRP